MKKPREQLRNERAEMVCREFRYQITRPPAQMDLNACADLLIKWMQVAKKNKYTRP